MTNIILTGFMGTGKTTIGKLAAQRLGIPFVDMDSEIEKLAGKPISSIFYNDGETAFRQMETELCIILSRQLEKHQGLVISTGGGTMINPDNRLLLTNNSIVVCLSCDVGRIIQRLNKGDTPDRPLLDVSDQRLEIEKLLDIRRETYMAFPWQIDTTYLTVEEVTTKVIKISEMVSLHVWQSNGHYDIHIGHGIMDMVGGVLRANGSPKGSRVAIISNPVVSHLYTAKVKKSLQFLGYKIVNCIIPDGERYKTLATVSTIYKKLLAGSLERKDIILALGGGVTGDIAGFAAATYMRGVRFIQLPTTLLAMVDASVGGKTGVDLPQGKNLVGAFKQPALVMMDLSTLETLPIEELRSGMAEVIKHGIIAAPGLFNEIEQKRGSFSLLWDTQVGIDWITRALTVKINIVEQDPFEEGRRAVLNFGHTVGHALEKITNYKLRHGEAVSIGMLVATRIAVSLGLANSELAERIETALTVWGLPVRCPHVRCNEIIKAMSKDKKKRGSKLRWVLPSDIGVVDVYQDVPQKIIKSVLNEVGAY
jgi:3-dehydroquinate synthase